GKVFEVLKNWPGRSIQVIMVTDGEHLVFGRLRIVTPKGGHLRWVAGENAPLRYPWTDPLFMDFLQDLENK
ncbi:hypothetical protein Tco_0946987, partial [Tanacetum coccineum]